MMYNFDEIIDRRHTNALNTDGFRGYIFHAGPEKVFPYKDEEFVRMWVADMEFGVAPEILDALRSRIDRRIFGYTGLYDDEYYHTFSKWCKDHYDWGFPKEQLCISPKYLSETVKAVSKRTPNEWIDSYVIMELCMLLRSSQRSIKEIAQSLNFSNQSFLGKYFKEHMGVSPSDYRNGASPRPRGKERLGDGA